MTFPKSKTDARNNNGGASVVARSKDYREPVVVWGSKEVKVSFYAFDPVSGVLKRKLVRLNRELKGIKGKRAKREYAEGVASRIRDELKSGWNPWMEQGDGLVYVSWANLLWVSWFRSSLCRIMKERSLPVSSTCTQGQW